ncbi:plastocyanin/azurin family copper-binding protein [Niallia oryzisoli]|uniref:plastocyanin/azurin family copper-binding protein n=1 Tax=Niallia oryzisoli TaxID=1737571 RepID=UPI003735415D
MFVIASIMSYNYKSRLKVMSGMILSMSIGTSVGLTVGILLGSLYQGNLFYSTLYSILGGILAGTICGLIFGVIPSLEGFMGGLMGGMMGAMLGEMIPNSQSIIMINLFLTLSVSTLFLFPILLEPSENRVGIHNKKWFLKPFFVFFFLLVYLFSGNQLNNFVTLSKSSSPNQESHHLNHNEELFRKENQQLKLTINVQPSQFSYNPRKVFVKKGQNVSLILKNEDSIDHDIEIKNSPFDVNGTGNHQDHINKKGEFHLHAPAGKQAKITFTPLKQGTYEFFCTIPGHMEKGMVGFLIIT